MKDVLQEYVCSCSPLAKGYRRFLASRVNHAGKSRQAMKVNTELCIDLRTQLHNDVLMTPGKDYIGILRRDLPSRPSGFDSGHYTFVETHPSISHKRCPHIFIGEYITVTRRDDGSYRPNFKYMKVGKGFTVDSYVLEVCSELRHALKSLVEKKEGRE